MAATVTGTILKPDNSVFSDQTVTFEKKSVNNTVVSESAVVDPYSRFSAVTDGSGQFSVSLQQGAYVVRIQHHPPFEIDVPDSGSHNITSLMES